MDGTANGSANGAANGNDAISNGHSVAAADATPEEHAPVSNGNGTSSSGYEHEHELESPVTTPRTLIGKVALVTGAGRGIGRGIAIELGARGASVVVNYANSKSSAEEVVAIIQKSGSKAIAIQADVSKVPEITKLFEEAKARFGKINIVASNSGTESFDKTEDITEDHYDHVFGLNTRAQFFVGQHAYKYCENGGRLILMSSIAAGLLGVADHALYNASKMAVNGFTKSFATDFGKKGMTCNAIAPGGVKSDMFTQVAWRYIPGADSSWPAEKIEKMMANHCPLGRCAVPADVARVVAFLASDDGGWVNGQIITISGGSGQ
ncbi:MAG: putative secondary metabolism biosynthetic enzyme [Pycnora praestabilis]|nr:MAG: putative secondary metabolism biosynthetic enzyme [Pycnora praestabilis]